MPVQHFIPYRDGVFLLWAPVAYAPFSIEYGEVCDVVPYGVKLVVVGSSPDAFLFETAAHRRQVDLKEEERGLTQR